MPSRKRCSNSSATDSTTMKRLAAMQLWPAFWKRASTATLAAASRSASSSTMNGSEPPSSSTVFLRARTAGAGHQRARVLAAGQRDGGDTRVVDQRLRLLAGDEQRLEHALGKPAAREHLFDGEGALRHVGGVLEHAGVARHQRRRGEAEHLPEGKVPGHDRQHRAERDRRRRSFRWRSWATGYRRGSASALSAK